MDQNSQKGSQNKAIIHYHLLWKSPFDVLLNSFIIWISDKEASRIIQSHHVTYTNESCFLLTACRNTAAYCITFLTVWNSWLRQQISKIPSLYKVLLSFCWNDEGKQAVETKAKCFKAWRLFLFSSLFLSNMHYWPSVRWSAWLDIWPNFFFLILLDFLKVLYFFPAWLCHETSSFARSPRDLTHWSSLLSLTFKNLWQDDL